MKGTNWKTAAVVAAVLVAAVTIGMSARAESGGGLWEMPLPEGWRVEGTLGEACRALEDASRKTDPKGRGLRFEVEEDLSVQLMAITNCRRMTFRDAALWLAEFTHGGPGKTRLEAVFCGDTAILAAGWCVAEPVVFALDARDAESGEAVPGARVENRWGLGAWTGQAEGDGEVKMCLLYRPSWRRSIGGHWLAGESQEEVEAKIVAEGYVSAQVRFLPEWGRVAKIPVLRVEMRRTGDGGNAGKF